MHGGHFNQLDRFFLEQDAAAGAGELEVIVFVVGDVEVAQVDELAQIEHPLGEGDIPAGAVGFDLVVAGFEDLAVLAAAQYVGEHAGAHLLP